MNAEPLLSHVAITGTLFALYPLRLLRRVRSQPAGVDGKPKSRIRIPATFDPAPLLYPPFLPVLVALSLLPIRPEYLLPNIVLGLAALPPHLIPGYGSGCGFNSVQWLLSLLPLTVSRSTISLSSAYTEPHVLNPPLPNELGSETVASLFALHQALLPPLQYVTTTSLLPAELQLLSISLIDLLLFAGSPQMVILAVLLWVGGVGLFVLCGSVLKWNVALARVPRWRLKRVNTPPKIRQPVLTMLSEALQRDLGLKKQERAVMESDADEDDSPPLKRPGITEQLRLEILDSFKPTSPATEDGEIKSAVEVRHTESFPIEAKNEFEFSPRMRRHTLPDLNGTDPNSHRASRPSCRRKRSSATHSFLSLTPSQATTRTWLYTGYVYIVTLFLIAIPIRSLIAILALHNHEPFGWAIGYLLGNIQPLRFYVTTHDLTRWIPLPPLTHPNLSTHLGVVQTLRLTTLGSATTRLLIASYYLLILAGGLATVLFLTARVEVDSRRKLFHGMMVVMLLPSIPVDPSFVALALALVLAGFLLLDLLRAAQLPPLSRPLARFLTPYVDGRDLRGPVVVSHIFLLVGCAVPLWLSGAGRARVGAEPWRGWEVEGRGVDMLAGVVCVGMGDAAASLVGRRVGRRKWPWAGGKSLEGSVAFAGAVSLGLVLGKAWLRVGRWEGGEVDWGGTVLKAGASACGASFMEAVLTGGNDNVVVPVVLWLLVRGVGL